MKNLLSKLKNSFDKVGQYGGYCDTNPDKIGDKSKMLNYTATYRSKISFSKYFTL